MSPAERSTRLGISGRIASAFQNSAITPLLAILGLLLGIFAVIITPKEEEPQIDVTFADVFIPYPGATPTEVENQVTLPAEQIISEIKGIDTLYSFSQPDGALIIAIFDVGVPRDEAVVNLYNQLYSNSDKFNYAAGIGEPLIKPRGIDDVPIVGLTLWSNDPSMTAEQLTSVSSVLETELKRIPGTREIYSQGGHELVLNVRLDPIKMNSYSVTFTDISDALQDNNQTSALGSMTQYNQEIKLQTGQFLRNLDDVKNLLIKVNSDTTTGAAGVVYLSDIADIQLQSDIPKQSVWHVNQQGSYPAVTIAIGKQAGENAVDIADAVLAKVAAANNVLIPDNVNVAISRNYGQTAGDKSNTLIFKLIFATSAVVLLVLFTMGVRESAVVGIAIIITLAITLFASWAWGFTLNRISLFALIFSIGILVDDAIVVVENIHRHMALSNKPMIELIPGAVDEVGGPTILATFTVIAALLPMAFVSGLMGPYMSPIPINASMGMLISLLIAFIMTPWLSGHLLKEHKHHSNSEPHTEPETALTRFFTTLMSPFLIGEHASKARKGLALGIMLLIAFAVALPVFQAVVLKMLPFDNKSEFQVMVDMPEGTPVEQTQRVLQDLSQYLTTVEEIEHIQLYAGTHAPMNFNGLVRHYFLRSSQELGDIQVNLVDKKHRDRDSHSIASSVREPLQRIALQYQANVKIVEVPPGPPVWSPIVAEVYAPTTALREQAANDLQQRFNNTDYVVDVDIFLPAQQQQWQVNIDRNKARLLGVSYSSIINAINSAVNGNDASYLHLEERKYPTPIRLQVAEAAKVDLQQVLQLRLPNQTGAQIALAELVQVKQQTINAPIVHKNMVPMIMVVADMAGPTGSPLYGMFDMVSQINHETEQGELAYPIVQRFVDQPDGLTDVAILWDGEWKITYETFRDMGIAYAVGMIAIYLLVVGQFKSYIVPLIIMAPIPLTIIGVMPGHALLGAQFTAPSMIGMIALAGIIVRNSILLVDFINQQTAAGVPFEQAVIHSGAVRAKPIMLTALAAMIGAMFIIDDPIFNGLAISLIFGIFISTILTLIVIPVLYYTVMKTKMTAKTH
ncbi:efflux RND transporter permease subunit [Shewanella saliphila]|uniref:Multidrug transporter AcrB n=1 Tax=Shewanella saliphila TaxID=2282698 RepID=A0ABQ2Q9Q4_9GAMM|nr:efflux RND transporter permease subunit [Shewanella saliphila]MCL1102753.1 efflux RND transporter permease subunit [Shewanella saliphila]GGP59682.1 multidrug transporter AcrB [Shewanella saliphila]